MKPIRALGLASLLLGTLAHLGCQRNEKPVSLEPPPPKPQLMPWSWHALGGLLVIEGEVDEPTELVLRGRYVNERRFVDLGPVRWEMYRPPPGATAELRTASGRLLASWDFDKPLPVAPAPPPKPATPPARSHRKDPVQPPPPKPEPRKVIPPPTPAPMPVPKSAPSKPAPAKPEPSKPAPKPLPAPVKPPASKTERPKAIPKPPEAPKAEPPKPSAPKPAPSRSEAAHPEPKAVVPLPHPQPPAEPTLPAVPFSGSAWPGSGEGFNLIRGPRGPRQVCLTFDGGSTSEVALDVLDALKERGLRCTFFLTGAFIQKFPDVVRRIDREGHEIGNHTQNHPHFAPSGMRDPRWTKDRFQEELLAADRALVRLLGRPMDPLWRAPYGEQTSELRKWAEELGYRHVGWSEGADTLDWATVKERKLYRTGNAILDRLRNRMDRQDGEGLIVLMHLGSARPVEDRPARVLGPFLDKALADGWRFVCVSAYLQAAAKPVWDRNRRASLLASGGASHVSAARH